MQYTTVQDLTDLWRPLLPQETTRAEKLLPIVEDSLRQEAVNLGKNLDEMVSEGKILVTVLQSVVVDVTARMLMTPTDDTPATQTSMGALGYTQSTTYLVPGGGLFIKRSELARLGLKRQQIGAIDLC